MCTDGLSNELDDREIMLVARQYADPQIAADQLVAAAVRAGGRDNVSVVVVAVDAGADDGEDDADTAPRTGLPRVLRPPAGRGQRGATLVGISSTTSQVSGSSPSKRRRTNTIDDTGHGGEACWPRSATRRSRKGRVVAAVTDPTVRRGAQRRRSTK